ncbi:MAG: histidine kinase dimerization/phospho-acceptor domain-containing protein [Nitrospira sp.]|nr:histidine kinase dimerization/phospho-acceptor domain-containing protein [Nitrospira sp.]
MKAGMLNGHAKRDAGKTRRTPSREKPLATAIADSDRMIRLLHVAQEMGGPITVVIGRMEYLLERGADRETARSLKAIISQAQQLAALRQQLLDEARSTLGVADRASPVLIEKGRSEA